MTASLSRRTTTLTLYQGDDFEILAELRREADIATALAEESARTAAARAGDDEPEPDAGLAAIAKQKQAEYNAFVDVAAGRAVEVRLRAMGGKPFRALMAEHPPRPEHELDKVYKANTDTMPDALLMESIEEPDFKSAERQAFIDDLADGDYERFWVSAYWLNRGTGGDPKASRYSTGFPSSDAT